MTDQHRLITFFQRNRRWSTRWSAVAMLMFQSWTISYAQTATPPIEPNRPEPVVTHQQMFSIPFFLNRNVNAPAEVLLYASGDQGETWRIYQRQPPTATKFDFRAGQDGEFWFCVRTDPDRGRPDSTTTPEKIVIVDSQQPQIQGSLSLNVAQQLTLQWRVDDAYLAPATFAVHYRSTEVPQWRPVPIRQQNGYQIGQPFVGEVSWTVAERTGQVEVRMTIADRAGNGAEFMDRIEIGSAPPATPTTDATFDGGLPDPPRLPEPSVGPQSTPPPLVAQPSIPEPLQQEATPWVPPERREPADLIPWRSNNDGFAREFPSDPFPPATTTTTDPLDRPDQGPPATTNMLSQTTLTDSTPRDGAWRRSAAAEQDRWNSAASTPVEGSYWPPVANRVDLGPTTPPSPTNFDLQMSKSRRFNLDYDISGVAAEDLAKVELWITEDQGQTWRAHGIDPDLTSPFLVEVDRDGSFGFRLLIYDRSGNATPPLPGEAPDLRVGVDHTAPIAKLESARLVNPSVNVDVDQSPGQLEIVWSATDEFLTEQPIQLSYSNSPNHSWIPISPPLANTGRFDWAMPRDVPARIYLRMEVTDRVGNVSIHQLTEPVQTRPTAPRARIRALLPL